MRTTLLPLILLCGPTLHAQLTAGEVPAGNTTYEPGIELSLGTAFTEDSADVELDCDDFVDLRAVLYRGAPEIDAPNSAELHFVDTDLEVCMDLASGFQQRPRYYSFGEPLDCDGGFNWQVGDGLVLGDMGGFMAIGPITIDSLYIAYRRGAELGWMLLSFDVAGNPDVDLWIDEILPLCQIPTSADEIEPNAHVIIHPNPSHGGPIQVQSTDPIQQIQVLDATGKLVAEYTGNTRAIDAPELPGIYLAKLIHLDSRATISRFIRY